MSNRIPIVVPCALSENPYEERIDLVEQARSLITRLEDRIEAKFRPLAIALSWFTSEPKAIFLIRRKIFHTLLKVQ